MEEYTDEGRSGQEDASGDRIIQVGPCRMKFVAEDDHTSHSLGDLPAPHENPRLMPLRDSSHLVQNKDSREDRLIKDFYKTKHLEIICGSVSFNGSLAQSGSALWNG